MACAGTAAAFGAIQQSGNAELYNGGRGYR